MRGERVGAERGRDVPARFRERARAARRSVVSSAEEKERGGAGAELFVLSFREIETARAGRGAASRARAHVMKPKHASLPTMRVSTFFARARARSARAERAPPPAYRFRADTMLSPVCARLMIA